jgi:hypothetical protein
MANIAITFGADAAASASATTITRTATYAAGETIAVLVHWGSTTITVSSVSDGTHTFTPRTVVTGANFTRRQQWFVAKNVAAGSFTITVTFSLTVGNRHVAYFRTANPDTTADPQDSKGQDQFSPGTGTDAVTTTNMTPTSQPAGVLATDVTYTSASTVTAGTGYTSLGVLTAFNALAGDTSRIEFQRITSTSAIAGTFTLGSADSSFSMGLILTEAAAAATETFPAGHSRQFQNTLIRL